MLKAGEDPFFTAKHDRLARVATIASVLSWIVFLAAIVTLGMDILRFRADYPFLTPDPDFGADFMRLLRLRPFFVAEQILDLLNSAIKTFSVAIVLKGVSVGLNMILETDLNYREFEEGKGDA